MQCNGKPLRIFYQIWFKFKEILLNVNILQFQPESNDILTSF